MQEDDRTISTCRAAPKSSAACASEAKLGIVRKTGGTASPEDSGQSRLMPGPGRAALRSVSLSLDDIAVCYSRSTSYIERVSMFENRPQSSDEGTICVVLRATNKIAAIALVEASRQPKRQ
ncbi:hypothetical protein Q7P35_004811 [Cladosporium inversicolor]